MKKRNIILYIVLLILLLGCTKLDNDEISLKQEDKIPESLEELNRSLDEILANLGELEKIELNIDNLEEDNEDNEKPDNIQENSENKDEEINMKENYEENKDEEISMDENDEENNNEGNNEEINSNSKNNGENDKKSTNENEESIKSEKTKKTWDKIDNTLEEVHYLWNIYEVEGIKKGGSSEKANQFNNSINKMTKAIENKDIMEIYDYASQGFLNLKPFLDLYTDDYKGEIAEIKYAIYQYYLEATNGNKSVALRVIRDKDENIQKIKSKIKDDDEEKNKNLDRVSYILKNLVNSLNEDSKRLYMIKKDTAIENIKDLEEH